MSLYVPGAPLQDHPEPVYMQARSRLSFDWADDPAECTLLPEVVLHHKYLSNLTVLGPTWALGMIILPVLAAGPTRPTLGLEPFPRLPHSEAGWAKRHHLKVQQLPIGELNSSQPGCQLSPGAEWLRRPIPYLVGAWLGALPSGHIGSHVHHESQQGNSGI